MFSRSHLHCSIRLPDTLLELLPQTSFGSTSLPLLLTLLQVFRRSRVFLRRSFIRQRVIWLKYQVRYSLINFA